MFPHRSEEDMSAWSLGQLWETSRPAQRIISAPACHPRCSHEPPWCSYRWTLELRPLLPFFSCFFVLLCFVFVRPGHQILVSETEMQLISLFRTSVDGACLLSVSPSPSPPEPWPLALAGLTPALLQPRLAVIISLASLSPANPQTQSPE